MASALESYMLVSILAPKYRELIILLCNTTWSLKWPGGDERTTKLSHTDLLRWSMITDFHDQIIK